MGDYMGKDVFQHGIVSVFLLFLLDGSKGNISFGS